MDTTCDSDYDHLNFAEAQDIFEDIKDTWDIGSEPMVPTYTWYNGCRISYETYQACNKKIDFTNYMRSRYGFKSLI